METGIINCTFNILYNVLLGYPCSPSAQTYRKIEIYPRLYQYMTFVVQSHYCLAPNEHVNIFSYIMSRANYMRPARL